MVIVSARQTEEDVIQFEPLAVEEDGNGTWGIDATAYVAWVRESTGTDLSAVSFIPAHEVTRLVALLSLYLSTGQPFKVAPHCSYGELLQFVRYLQGISYHRLDLDVTRRN